MFTFQELCGSNVGAADYLAIAGAYHTIFIENIPLLDINNNSDVMRRFISLVDTLYVCVCVRVSPTETDKTLFLCASSLSKLECIALPPNQ